MPTIVAKDLVLTALTEEWGHLDRLGASLTDEQWAAQSVLPGWSVQDVLAHIVATERLLSGDPIPGSDEDVAGAAHVRNPIGIINERWLTHYRTLAPAAVLDDFRSVTTARLETLNSMSQQDFDTETLTPVGPESYGRFMRIRLFDSWMHELDIRDSLGSPASADPVPVGLSLDEVTGALPVLVGKRAAAPRGSTIRFALTGIGARTIDIEVPERATVVPELSGPPTVTLTADTFEFARHLGGRSSARPDGFAVDGDTELGNRIVANLRFTI